MTTYGEQLPKTWKACLRTPIIYASPDRGRCAPHRKQLIASPLFKYCDLGLLVALLDCLITAC